MQIRDLISERKVGWGKFGYTVRVHADAQLAAPPLAQRAIDFTAVDPAHPETASVAAAPAAQPPAPA